MVESRLWCRNAQRYVYVVYRERVAESEFNLKCDSTTTQPQYNSRCGQFQWHVSTIVLSVLISSLVNTIIIMLEVQLLETSAKFVVI